MPGPAPPAASEPCAPCGSFALDLAAEIGHTTCRRCGFPKRAHGPPATLQSPELRRKLSKRESINGAVELHDGDDLRERLRGDVHRGGAPRPCRNFRRDLSGRSYDSCVCGWAQGDHGAKEPTRGASSELRDALRGTSRRSFDEANDCFVSVKIPADAPAHGDDSDDDAEAAFFCGGPAAGSFACSGFSFLS